MYYCFINCVVNDISYNTHYLKIDDIMIFSSKQDVVMRNSEGTSFYRHFYTATFSSGTVCEIYTDTEMKLCESIHDVKLNAIDCV